MIAKQLHQASDEAGNYTASLLERLEQLKERLKDDDTVNDDVVAKAYVEVFALETLQRAERAMHDNRATR